MKKEDFKEITEKHINTARDMVNLGAICDNVLCDGCPFNSHNSTLNIDCCSDIYSTEEIEPNECDEKLLQSAKEFLEMCEKDEDKIKSPNHYKLEGLGIESIDIIKSRLGKDGFKAFCVGNVIKYILRAEKKNGLEDYKKSRQYLDWVIEEAENKI